MRHQGNHQGKWLFATAVAVAVLVAPFAVASGEGEPIEGGVRNPSNNQTRELMRETEIIASTSTYGTRQSNKSDNGGGAIYGCRSGEGGTPRGNEPCIRANNLANGLAFEFESDGNTVGRIDAEGGGGEDTRPFTTNATGVATGLNADRVDGASASQLRTRWLLVNAAGEIERQSGGFRIVAAYPANPNAANGNVYIDAGEDLTDNGITATIALQNTDNQRGGTMNGTNGEDGNPDAGDNLEFSGEISATQCQLPGIVACAPEGARNPNSFVVSPRLSNGERTTNDTRKRFYVMITE